MIEVPVVCCRCQRVYRQAKIVPITPAPLHITGTCDDCKQTYAVRSQWKQRAPGSHSTRPGSRG